MVFCELDFRCCLSIQRPPYLTKIKEGCCSLESICSLPRCLARFHSVVCSLESFLAKLFNVCLTGQIINNSIIVREVGFGLFELIHKGHGVRHAVCICFMKLLGEDLFNDPVVAPVCYHRFGLLDLASTLGKSSYVCCLQGRRDSCCHLPLCCE